MKYLKLFENWLSESTNEDANYWYKILDKSHQAYVDDEEKNRNSDNTWDEEADGPKPWIFDMPVHEYLKKKDMVYIVPAIVKFGEAIGLASNFVEIDHYMLNDFSIKWKGHEYPVFSFSLEGNEHENQARVIKPGEDRTLHNIVGAHLKIELYARKNKEYEWTLTSEDDIADVMMDLYSMKSEI